MLYRDYQLLAYGRELLRSKEEGGKTSPQANILLIT